MKMNWYSRNAILSYLHFDISWRRLLIRCQKWQQKRLYFWFSFTFTEDLPLYLSLSLFLSLYVQLKPLSLCRSVEIAMCHFLGSHYYFCIYNAVHCILSHCCMPVGSTFSKSFFFLVVFLCQLAGGFILAFALSKPTVVICKSCGLSIKITWCTNLTVDFVS